MKAFLTKLRNIKNFGIKLIVGLFGVVMMIAPTFRHLLYWFNLSEEMPDAWSYTQSGFMAVGFVLAFGGYKYNAIVNLLLTKLGGMSDKIKPNK